MKTRVHLAIATLAFTLGAALPTIAQDLQNFRYIHLAADSLIPMREDLRLGCRSLAVFYPRECGLAIRSSDETAAAISALLSHERVR